MSETNSTNLKELNLQSQNKSDTQIQVSKINLKTKIFSLLLLLLLIIPAFLVNPRYGAGMVLGVTETNLDTTPQNLEIKENNNIDTKNNSGLIGSFFREKPKINPTPKQSQLGQIGSGAMEVRTIQDEKPIVKGKVIWDKNAKTAVATDKFNLGTSITVSYKEKNLSLVVGDNRVLSADTVLVVDKETFIKLGGNPEIENSLEVMARVE